MRQFIDIIRQTLLEDEKPTKTRERGMSIMPDLEKAISTPRGEIVPGKRAGKAKTDRAVANALARPEVRAAAANVNLGALAGIEDEISDAEAARRAGLDVHHQIGNDDPLMLDGPTGTDLVAQDGIEATTENLPAVVSQEVSTEAGREINPEWHRVNQLPGYMRNVIRAVARQVFQQFPTSTPMDEMQMICTITNPERDVKAVMDWVRRNGAKDDEATLNLNTILPGFTVEIQHWRTKGFDFLIMKDMGGYYVYGGAGGRGVHLDEPTPRGHLR